MSSSSLSLPKRAYYRVKPFLPSGLRWSLRRWHAGQIYRKCADRWPIDEAAGQPPKNWKGWPEGQRFAFVLTHDVESRAGLEKVRQLAELEMEFGFRSSFNFVPEGAYRVPDDLLAWLEERGFEVGVHDLHHDGRLFSSRELFRQRADKINRYLEEWGAVGFRGGFMLRNLEWLHDLNLRYDASTFDTDPFEPQPGGEATIFPFWVQNGGPSRYVELPYTLPQDSTLFLLLREKTADIWKRKLDWLAEKGGLALVIIHPDYIDFGGDGKSGLEYPVARVRELFSHLRESWGDAFWNPLPREVAGWYENESGGGERESVAAAPAARVLPPSRPAAPALTGNRVAVLLYSYYPADPRPRRAAEALAQAGAEVDLFCLREDPEEPLRETIRGVRVFRVPLSKNRNTKIGYVLRYASFLAACFWQLAMRHPVRRYQMIHVHNMPDVLVFSALVPRLCGARVILDLHDPMPELMRAIYQLSSDSLLVRVLKWCEKWSVRFAHRVLTPNKAFRDLFVRRGCPPEKIKIIMNSPEGSIFDPKEVKAGGAVSGDRPAEPRPFRIMHHGFIAERHGIDIAYRAVALLRDRIPGIELHLYGGRTAFLDELEELARELDLGDCLKFHGFQSQATIAQAIAEADLGVIPNRRSSFTEINMPTRIFEYLAMNRPVIVPDTTGIRDYFDDDTMFFFDPGDEESLAGAIEEVFNDPKRAETVAARGRKIYESHQWGAERENFLHDVEDLLA